MPSVLLRRVLLYAIVSMIGASEAHGRYGHQGFASLYASAEAIALGEIVEVRESTYRFRADEVFRTPTAPFLRVGDVIEVSRFQNWRCASRWTPYRKGQRSILFVSSSESASKKAPRWRALGAANEGELPVETERVFVGAQGDGSLIDETHEVYGASYPSRVFPLSTVLTALRTGKIPDNLLGAPLNPKATPSPTPGR